MKGVSLQDLQRNPNVEILSVGASVQVPEVEPRGRGRTEQPSGMNKLESQYAAHLEAQKHAGEIAGYWYEPLKFRLADKTYFSPDFMVMLLDGLIEFHETKGFMRDDAAIKLKVAASQFWMFPFRLVKRSGGEWLIKEVSGR